MFNKILVLLSTVLLMSCSPATIDLTDAESVPDRPWPRLPGGDHLFDNDDSETNAFGSKPAEWIGNTPVRWSTCGTRPEEYPCNFVLLDQNGEEFQLYDHYNQAIVVDFSAGWCAPCHRAADEVQKHYDNFIDDGLIYITILIETASSEAPTVADLEDWANLHNITTAPVLAGSRALLKSSGGDWRLTAWPTFYFIDKEMNIYATMRGWSEESLLELIEEIL